MVYLKNSSIVLLALLLSFFLTEILIRITINHPVYNIDKKVYGIRKSFNGISEMYLPHTRYSSTENGYQIYETNNLGLFGSDVRVSDTSEYIFVLGSSFVIANQIAPEKIATSIFQNKLDKKSKYQVLNLGENGTDPYDLYFRMKYFTQYYKPKYVILIIEMADDGWFSRHETLDFSLGNNFGNPIKSNTFNIEKYIRHFSSFINLASNGFKNGNGLAIGKNENNLGWELNDPNQTKVNNNLNKISTCINKYGFENQNKFFVISIMDNYDINSYLKDYCKSINVEYYFKGINIPENKFEKIGHLNEQGNLLLGEFIFDCFNKFRNEK